MIEGLWHPVRGAVESASGIGGAAQRIHRITTHKKGTPDGVPEGLPNLQLVLLKTRL